MFGVILLSVLFGIVLTLLVQYIFFRFWLKSLPVVSDKWKSQSDPFVLPQELLKIFEHLNEQEEKESYKSLNFVFQFLFQELKDADHVRKWAMKKLKNEFSELLHSTTGKLLDEIRIRGFNLGRTFPIIKNVSLSNVSVNEDSTIDEVAILLDLTYNGRFQLAVDVGIVFGKSAYLSVTVTKLQGTAKLQFSTIPYRHWSFAFTKDPVLEFEVDSHFEGRPIAGLASIITNQIKRQVRKKHTLPNYKIRYKPFFVMPTQKVEPKDVYFRNIKLSIGKLNVVVVGCTRLLSTPPDSYIYCSLAIDSMPWTELMDIKKKLSTQYECELVKSSPELGMVFEDEFLLEKFEEVVVVTSVVNGSPAHKAGIRKNDVMIGVNGIKVASSKQAFRIIRQSPEKVIIKVERDDSRGSEISQNVSESKIKKVPSMDSLSSFTKDLNMKDSSMSKTSQEYLSVPKQNGLEGMLNPNEGPQLKSASSSQSMNTDSFPTEFKDKEQSSAKIGKSEKEAYVENLLAYNPSKSEELHIGEPTNAEAVMKKTRMFLSHQNPVFNQRFQFDVKEHHRYLNICVWCREVEKVDKQLKVTKVDKDTLLGHVSISLMDIALECSTTIQGDFTNSFNLVPSQSKMGMGRQQYSSVSGHPGFEERLCHGDVLLRFHYSRENNDFEDKLEIFDSFLLENVNATSQTKTEKVSSNFHCFQPAQFQSAVHCKFCSKKIWFKSAFMCTMCKMVCHKKCIEKCQLQTMCTRATDIGVGERKRHKSAPDDQKKPSEANIQPIPPELDSLTRKSSSSSLKDLSVTEPSTENSESSAMTKRNGQCWKTSEENADEKIVTAAKSIGRQLYSDLEIELRKEKFDEVILAAQMEIEKENRHQVELQNKEKKIADKKMKSLLRDKIKNSEEKLKSLKVLMLQYCAGLQFCLDEEESMRQKKASQLPEMARGLMSPEALPLEESKEVGQSEIRNMNLLASELEFIDEGKDSEVKDLPDGDKSFSDLINMDFPLSRNSLREDDESELLEVQALLAFQHSIDTSSQRSLEVDISPDEDYLPETLGEFLELNGNTSTKYDGALCKSDDGDKEVLSDGLKIEKNYLGHNASGFKEEFENTENNDDGKIRFEL